MAPRSAFIAVACVAIIHSTSVVADATLVVERPTWKAGDTWTLKRTNTRNDSVSTFHWSVTAARPDGSYTIDFGGRPEIRDADFNVEPANGPEYKAPWFRWPQRVGDRWTYDLPLKMEIGNGSESTTREVIATETVEVPAGRFECLKIASTQTWMSTDPRVKWSNYSTLTERTDWFCPAVRGVAKRIEVSRDIYGTYSRMEAVLISYRIAD